MATAITLNRDNILKPKMPVGGYIFRFPLGTVVSEDPNEPLPALAVTAGYLNADSGIKFGDNRSAGDPIVALGGDALTTPEGIYDPQIEFTIWEVFSKNALDLVYGPGEVTYDEVTDTLTIHDKGGIPEACGLVFQVLSNGNRMTRTVWDRVEFVSRGDRTISNDGLFEYPLVYKAVRVGENYSRSKTAPFVLPGA
jgi:hypothetical protein